MRVRSAVIAKTPGDFEVIDIELDPPRRSEILVRMVASGLCHSDDHITTGDMPVGIYPMAGGHEGAGIVQEVGPYRGILPRGPRPVFLHPSVRTVPLVRERHAEPMRPRRP